MYRNYDFVYGRPPPPRRRVPVPDFPFREPHFRRGYGDPFMADPWMDVPDPWLDIPDPYVARQRPVGFPGPYPRTRGPRPRGRGRGGISEFSTQLVNKQIVKATEKNLSQCSGSQTTENNTDIQESSKDSTVTDEKQVQDPESCGDTSEKDTETTVSAKTSTEPGSQSSDAARKPSQPAVPIGPRIPAKQMWESSYREVVSEKDEAESLMPAPTTQEAPSTAPAQNVSVAASKRKQKYNKFKRPPYFKRKKKADAGNQNDGTGDGATEGDDVATYPRMCSTCNVQLTSAEQEKIHRASEIHANNMENPTSQVKNDSTKMSLEKLNETIPLPTNTPDCLRWEADTGDRTVNTVRFCRLCSVRMTSLQNAKQHYDGKSHAKRIRIVQRGHRPARKPFKPTHFISGGQLGMGKPNLTGAYSYSQAFIQAQPQGIQASLPAINLKPCLPGDFANSMTPSGQYYCQTCKVMIEHAASLNAHLQSREHKLAKAKS